MSTQQMLMLLCCPPRLRADALCPLHMAPHERLPFATGGPAGVPACVPQPVHTRCVPRCRCSYSGGGHEAQQVAEGRICGPQLWDLRPVPHCAAAQAPCGVHGERTDWHAGCS